jgi:hypothetical protein
MTLRLSAALTSVVLLVSCSNSTNPQSAPEQPVASTSVAGERITASAAYDYDAPIPSGPAALADELKDVSAGLDASIDEWVGSGTEPGSDARPVLLRAIRQQRIYRNLLDHPRVYAQVREQLPHDLRLFADKTMLAGNRLRSLVSPLDEPPDWTIHKPAPARRLLKFYKAGQRRFNIPWEILASLNFVESRYGRIIGPSSAGAQGPMQFMPATWAAYGNGGDINDPHDSIIGAARYLSASGAPSRMWDALYAYNHSNDYVKAILVYARQIMRDPKAFYAYYHWQVYVLTKDGDMQLSGPGADV